MRTINSVIEHTAKLHPDTIPDAITLKLMAEAFNVSIDDILTTLPNANGVSF